MIPTDTIDKLEATWRSLSALCAGLDEAQWKLPTDLPGWTVQDNLAHLIGIERVLEGLPTTGHRAPAVAYVKNPIGEMNEHEVDARRGLAGAQVLAEWDALVERRLQSLRNGDDDYFAVPWATPTGPGTLADFLHIRVLDCWLHEQDIRRALGAPGHLAGPTAEHTIDRLIRTLPIVIGKRAGTPEGGAVVFDITGEVPRHLVYEVTGGRAGLVESPSAAPLATISMTTDAFVTLASGRRTADQVDGVSISGDTELGRSVATQLNMMI